MCEVRVERRRQIFVRRDDRTHGGDQERFYYDRSKFKFSFRGSHESAEAADTHRNTLIAYNTLSVPGRSQEHYPW